MDRPRCPHVLLASTSIGEMDYCPACQVAALHIGSLSLRLDPNTAESLWVLITEGVAGLREELANDRLHRHGNKAS